jgi:transposase
MTTPATCHVPESTTAGTLFVAFELSEKTWKLGCTPGHGHKPRERTVTARQQERVLEEIAQAKRRLGLPDTAPVVRCYEAGREGFWLHRFLLAKVPAVEAEDHRHLHRDLETLKQERASTMTRIEGLLSSQGLRVVSLTKLPEQLDGLRLWDGSPIPPGLRRRVLRVYAHDTVLSAQIAEGEAERRAQLHASADTHIDKVRQLMLLKGIGINGAWLLVMAFFGWRACKHRREVGG